MCVSKANEKDEPLGNVRWTEGKPKDVRKGDGSCDLKDGMGSKREKKGA